MNHASRKEVIMWTAGRYTIQKRLDAGQVDAHKVTFYITEKDCERWERKGKRTLPPKGNEAGIPSSYPTGKNQSVKRTSCSQMKSRKSRSSRLITAAACQVAWRNFGRDRRTLTDTVNTRTLLLFFILLNNSVRHNYMTSYYVTSRKTRSWWICAITYSDHIFT